MAEGGTPWVVVKRGGWWALDATAQKYVANRSCSASAADRVLASNRGMAGPSAAPGTAAVTVREEPEGVRGEAQDASSVRVAILP